MSVSRENPGPYGSAYDLPSVIEMRQLIGGMKLVTRLVGRSQRQDWVELERQMDELFGLVDQFYSCLGTRHWIFTDQLPVSEVRTLLASASGSQAAEHGLIDIIAEHVRGPHWRMGLFGHEAMSARCGNLERARQHYIDEQWDSCTLLLVTVMDGFVNDVETADRRGLHAREPEEMVVWDSLVGHHKGLTSVMPVFLKPCYKRQDEEVFELHRHGIVHGTIVNYNNQVVATKAWNMLSAVVDWDAAKVKAALPPKPKPTLREVITNLRNHADTKRQRAGNRAWSIEVNEPTFADNEVVQQAINFLESWRAERWGLVARSLPTTALGRETTAGKSALRAKRIYRWMPLIDFTITKVSFPQLSIAVVHGTATIADQTGPIEIRWVHEGADGWPAKPGDDTARWVLAIYPPQSFIINSHPSP